MIKILEGQISFGGMQDALEAIARHRHVKYGLLRVTSNTCSGLMGIFCGRFITGAVLTLSGESGMPALKRLLTAGDGTFAFLDVSSEPLPELNQSLAVDLQALLATPDFRIESIPSSEESLVGIEHGRDEIHAFDTAIGDDLPPAPELTPERINQTYQRIVSFSEQAKAREADQTPMQPAATPVQDEFWDEPPEYARRQQTELPKPIDISTMIDGGDDQRQSTDHQSVLQTASPNYSSDFDNSYEPQEPRFKSTDEFKRLKGWRDKSAMITVIVWTFVILGLGAGIYYYGPAAAGFISKLLPQKP